VAGLEAELKALIVDVLSMEDLSPEDIGDEQHLFEDEGLGLDSIDALELGVAIQKKYGVKLDTKDDKLKQHFVHVRALAQLIQTHAPQLAPKGASA
jgi:acyl carrier protein